MSATLTAFAALSQRTPNAAASESLTVPTSSLHVHAHAHLAHYQIALRTNSFVDNGLWSCAGAVCARHSRFGRLRVHGHLLEHRPDDGLERDTVFGRESFHDVVHVQKAPFAQFDRIAKLQGENGSHASTASEFLKSRLSVQLFEVSETETRHLCSIWNAY